MKNKKYTLKRILIGIFCLFTSGSFAQNGSALPAPSGLAVTSSGKDSIAIKWNAITSDVSTVMYTVFVDGQASQVSNTTFTATGLTEGTYYNFDVQAFDTLGNESELASLYASTVSNYGATYDTYIRGGKYGDRSYANGDLHVRWATSETHTRQGYVQFDISYQNFDAASVKTAKLKLYCKSKKSPANIVLHGIDDETWTNSVTWNTAPEISDPAIAVDPYIVEGEWAEFDVTDYIKSKMAGSNTISFKMVAESGDVKFYGSENWEKRPALYILGEDNAAPTTPVIASAIADTSFIDMTWNPAFDSVGVANYMVYLNNEKVATLDASELSYTFPSLASGVNFDLGIVAVDLAGKVSGMASVNVLTLGGIDVIPPTPPTNLAISEIGMFDARLDFTPATDNYGLLGYTVFVNGDSIAAIGYTAKVYNFTTLNPATNYTVGLSAFDNSGNKSAIVELTFNTLSPPDIVPPSTPENLSATNISPEGLDLVWDASTDNVGVKAYEVYEGFNYLGEVTGTSYAVTVLPAKTEYTFYVSAIDISSNKSEPAELVVSTKTSINSVDETLAKVWSDSKTIYVSVASQDVSVVEIYNVTGKLVYTNKINEGLNEINDIATKGIYLVKTNIGERSVVNRVIIK